MPATRSRSAGGRSSAEICAGRPVIASLAPRGSSWGHTVVVKGFSTRPAPRVLVVDPMRLCPSGRDCEGELDEGFWISYDEYASGWGGIVHWVDFFGIRRKSPADHVAILAVSRESRRCVRPMIGGRPLRRRR